MRGRGSEEHGAVAIIVAITMTAILAMAALVLDIGDLWQTRRRVITSTDAAALAAARAFANREDGCAAAAEYLRLNDPNAIMDPACTGRSGGTASFGYITITARHDRKTTFGPLLGVNSVRAKSSSSAQWGTPRNVVGILPFGVCTFADGYVEYKTNPAQIYTVSNFNPQRSSNQCKNGPTWATSGMWATLGLGPSANTITSDLVNQTVCNTGGFPYPMIVGDSVPGDQGSIFQGIDGRGTDGQYALDCMLRSYRSDPNFWYGMAVLDSSTKTRGKVTYHVEGFVGIQVTSDPVPDPAAPGELMFDIRYFRFPTGSSPCCVLGGGGTAKAIRLCAVDGQDPATLCLR